MTVEVGLDGHKSLVQRANTPCGSPVRGYPTPNWLSAEVKTRNCVRTYLVHNIDEALGIVPGELSDCLDLILVQEYRRDQKDALVCGERMTDQPFPGWKVTTREDTVRPTDG